MSLMQNYNNQMHIRRQSTLQKGKLNLTAVSGKISAETLVNNKLKL